MRFPIKEGTGKPYNVPVGKKVDKFGQEIVDKLIVTGPQPVDAETVPLKPETPVEPNASVPYSKGKR